MPAAQSYPTGAEYVEALQNTSLCFADPDLRGAPPTLNRFGRPKPISGNFATVFELRPRNGPRRAVKCFTRATPDQAQRYRAVSERLHTVSAPWKVGFDYLERGVLVHGTWYPALKMEWVAGTNLSRWLEDHLNDPPQITRLAERFTGLVAELADAEVAHGDLQHGNLLITDDGSLHLVDYDGMYVPRLRGFRASEMGHRNYQSPRRSDTDFGPELDRFSAWVIYLSLVALAAEPALWHRLREKGGEYLLLNGDDFAEPAHSSRFLALLEHPDAKVSGIAEKVRDQLDLPLGQLPELTSEARTSKKRRRTATAPPTPSMMPGRALPAWMAGHLPRESVVTFTGHRPVSGLALRVLMAVVFGVFGVFAVLGLPSLIVAAVIATGCLGSFHLVYRRRPEAREEKDVRRRNRALLRRLGSQRRERRRLNRGSDRLDRSAKAHAANFDARWGALRARQDQQTAHIDQRSSQALDDIYTQLQKVTRRRDAALDETLRRFQQNHMSNRLGRIRIDAGQIADIGAESVHNLRQAGIESAADFTGIRLVSKAGRYGGHIAYLVLPDGRGVRVEGIGEVRATRLDQWRENHWQRALRTGVPALSPAQRSDVAKRFEPQERQLNDLKDTVIADSVKQRAAVIQRMTGDRDALADERRRGDTELRDLRDDLDRRIAALDAESSVAEREAEEAKEELARYGRIGFTRFVWFTLTGRSV